MGCMCARCLETKPPAPLTWASRLATVFQPCSPWVSQLLPGKREISSGRFGRSERYGGDSPLPIPNSACLDGALRCRFGSFAKLGETIRRSRTGGGGRPGGISTTLWDTTPDFSIPPHTSPDPIWTSRFRGRERSDTLVKPPLTPALALQIGSYGNAWIASFAAFPVRGFPLGRSSRWRISRKEGGAAPQSRSSILPSSDCRSYRQPRHG